MRNNYSPLVSIIITSYNREKYIGKAIESALQQDYANLEVIVVDNCSADNTIELVQQYVNDYRFRFIENETNIGMIRNFQKGIGLAKGDIISFVSSDDYLLNSSFISESVNLFNKHKNVVHVQGLAVTFTDNNNSFRPYSIDCYKKQVRSGREVFWESQYKESPLGFDGCAIRASALKFIDVCYDSKMNLLDVEIGLKLCLIGDIAYINKPCYAFRVHSNQSTQTYNDEMLLANIAIIQRASEVAIVKGAFESNQMIEWSNNMVYKYIKSAYLKRYLQNFEKHKKFEALLISKYPNIYTKLKREWKIVFLRFLYNPYYNLIKVLKFLSPKYYQIVYNLKEIGR
ncbi:MAG: glycosyltransferase [Bacteroidota bacterium]|nr:glycosyltransferase [Bacteroidota bacterium]